MKRVVGVPKDRMESPEPELRDLDESDEGGDFFSVGGPPGGLPVAGEVETFADSDQYLGDVECTRTGRGCVLLL